MMWSLHIFIQALLCIVVYAVDRGNYKSCQQSGFCKRHRALQPNQSPYLLLTDTVDIKPTKISAQVMNRANNVPLNLELFALQDNTARIKISEINPIRQRFEIPVGDVLVSEPTGQNLEVVSNTQSGLSYISQGYKVLVQTTPFRIDFVTGSEPLVSFNAQGLLKFEHYRQKSGGVISRMLSWISERFRTEKTEEHQEEHQAEEDKDLADHDDNHEENEERESKQDSKKNEEEEGMWEETYKTHVDSKPYGPSSIGVDIELAGFEHVYGIPEHADNLALKSTKSGDPYRLYNLDVFEYEIWNPMALYGSVPLMLAHNEKRTIGIFWHNAAETWIDVNSNTADKNFFSKIVKFMTTGEEIPQIDTHWMSESGIIDVFILLGPSPADVFRQYARLTGTTPLPPLFALSYHQSRWNYNDQDDVASVDNNFDEYDIPMDVIWLDIEHTDGKRYFTWDQYKFSHPEEMIRNISAKGRKMVTIIDPHIKRDEDFTLHKTGREQGYYIKNKDGNDYEGWCWPGSSSWLDYLNPAVRQFWASRFDLKEYQGSTLDLYTWNDMNEPAVFNGPENSMHKDAKHFGGWEHRDVHNIYGMLLHRSTVEGQLQRSGSLERTFVLSRAFFAGTQRYGAVWTGDNTAEWNHLKVSVPMLLSLNIAGITFSGADIGGFFKNPEPELLTRWYQAAAYQPFFRAHAHIDTRRREPWLLPEDNLKIVRSAVKARYSLLPYWYTLFFRSEQSGMPIMRPLWVDFPTEKETFAIDNSHLIGSALLVHPVTDSGSSGVTVYFPGINEVWYDVDDYNRYDGHQSVYVSTPLNKIPVFQRGGHIVPRRERQRRSSSLTHRDPFTLIVTLDKLGKAAGELYIDDYHTHQYKNLEFAHRMFTYADNKLINSDLHPMKQNNRFETDAWLERVVVVGLQKSPNKVDLVLPGSEKTPLGFKYDEVKKVLIIRKPAVNIAKEWVIVLA